MHRAQHFVTSFLLASFFVATAGDVAGQVPEPQLAGDLDPYFDTRFGFPSLDLFTEVATAGETGVYIGGSFKSVAKLRIAGLTRWDGRRFHSMGVTGTVGAIGAANGLVYVGGGFQVQAGGTTARGIACWDERRREWSLVGTGVGPRTGDREPGFIRAIALLGGHVYVAGNFASVDGVAAAGIARWNGSAWSAVNRGVGTGSQERVYALAATADGKILAGGEFDSIVAMDGARIRARSLAAYDPATNLWSQFGGGLGGDFFSAEVHAIAVDGSRVYVGGEFIEAGSIDASHVAMWDGARWNSLGGGVEDDGFVGCLTVQDGILYIGGGFGEVGNTRAFNVARWDGTRWSGTGGTDDRVDGLAFWKGELYAVGALEEAGDVSVEYAARWSRETGKWRALGEGLTWLSLTGEINAIATDSQGRIFVGGNFTSIGGKDIQDLAMWDGTEWHAVGSGVNDFVNDLLMVGDQLYVGGAFTQAGGRTANAIARWNIATQEWSALGSGVNRSVFTMEAAPDGTIYVGGHFSAAGGTDARNLAIYDPGTNTWSKTPFDFPVAILGGCYCVRALEAVANGVFIGGTFPHASINGRRFEAKSLFYWDRTSGEAVSLGDGFTYAGSSSDITGTVHDLLVTPQGELYAGGHFDKVNGVGAQQVARLAGGAWQPLGSGLSHSDKLVDPVALRFLRLGSKIVVTGRFTAAGEADSLHAAIWDTETSVWSAFGTGFEGERDEQVNTVELGPDGSILFGGEFVLAGNTPAASFVIWKRPEDGALAK